MTHYLPLGRINARYDDEIRAAISRVLSSGWYLQGAETEAFEREYADYIGTRCCTTCANGLDALALMLRALVALGRLERGDAVAVPANTYIATILAVSDAGLVPVLVEPRLDTYQMDAAALERAVTPQMKAVMLVHLYGQPAMTAEMAAVIARHGLMLLEDNAQAHGARYGQRRTGSLGTAAAHSFYPGKNLGAMGDAGAVTTDDEELASLVRVLGNYGSSRKYVFTHLGRNSRMDELQAAVLRVKLAHLEADNARRRAVARQLAEGIALGDGGGAPRGLTLPTEEMLSESVFHIFPVRHARRDELQAFLAERGIGTMIHYPIPPHRQACYAGMWPDAHLPVTEQIHREELSLPCHPAMTSQEIAEVARGVREFGHTH